MHVSQHQPRSADICAHMNGMKKNSNIPCLCREVPGDERQLLPEQSAVDHHRENEAAAAANFGVHQIWLQLPKQAFKAKGKECGVREPFL